MVLFTLLLGIKSHYFLGMMHQGNNCNNSVHLFQVFFYNKHGAHVFYNKHGAHVFYNKHGAHVFIP